MLSVRSSLVVLLVMSLLVLPENGSGTKAGRHRARARGRDMVAATQVCQNATKRLSQVVILVETVRSEMSVLIQWVKDVTNEIKERHPNVQFALTSFGDYASFDYLKPGADGQYGKDPEGCYKFHLAFGTTLGVIHKKLDTLKITQWNERNESSSFSALLFTVADNRIGWIQGSHKTVIFATTSGPAIYGTGLGATHWPAKGDGKDTCSKRRPPTVAKLGEIFKKKEINYILGFLGTLNGPGIIMSFDDPLSKVHTATQINYDLIDCPDDNDEEFEECAKKDSKTGTAVDLIEKDLSVETCGAVPTPKPTTTKPTTVKPTTSKPTTRKSTTRRPTTAKPITSKPTTPKPANCQGAEKRKVQVAIVIETVHESINVITGWVKKITNSMSKKHPDTEFALTTFGDYPAKNREDDSTVARPAEERGQYGSDPEGCYKFYAPFGTGLKAIHRKIDNITKNGITQFNLFNASSCLTALLFTAADKKLGWKDGSHKTLLFATTNYDSTHNHRDKFRKEPVGDGNDKCATHRPPTMKTLYRVLKEKGINFIVGFLGVFDDSKEIESKFEGHLHNIERNTGINHEVIVCPDNFTTNRNDSRFDICADKDAKIVHVIEQIHADLLNETCDQPTTAITTTTTKKPTTTTRKPTTKRPTPKPTPKPTPPPPPPPVVPPAGDTISVGVDMCNCTETDDTFVRVIY